MDANGNDGYDYARALILIHNKELVQQIVCMALPLAGVPKALVYGRNAIDNVSTIVPKGQNDKDVDDTDLVHIAVVPSGLQEPHDFKIFREAGRVGWETTSHQSCD